MAEQGEAFMGVGEGEGENRVIDALRDAKENPLLKENGVFGKARRFLINVTCREDELTLVEIDKISEDCKNMTGRDAHTIFGLTYDDSLGEKVRVTMIATGLQEDKPQADYDHVRPPRRGGGGRRALASQAAAAGRGQGSLFDVSGRGGPEPGRMDAEPLRAPAADEFYSIDERDLESPAFHRINKD